MVVIYKLNIIYNICYKFHKVFFKSLNAVSIFLLVFCSVTKYYFKKLA